MTTIPQTDHVALAGAAGIDKPRVTRYARGLSDRTIAWLFIAPTIALLLAINIFPLIWMIRLSFTSLNLSMSYLPLRFVGLDNFSDSLTDEADAVFEVFRPGVVERLGIGRAQSAILYYLLAYTFTTLGAFGVVAWVQLAAFPPGVLEAAAVYGGGEDGEDEDEGEEGLDDEAGKGLGMEP